MIEKANLTLTREGGGEVLTDKVDVEIIELPNAGDEKKSCAVSDKVVWKEKVILDYFDIAAWTLISILDCKGGPERSCTKNPIFCERKEECYHGVQQDQVCMNYYVRVLFVSW